MNRKTIVNGLVGGVFGGFMASLGYTVTTAEYWIAFSMLVVVVANSIISE